MKALTFRAALIGAGAGLALSLWLEVVMPGQLGPAIALAAAASIYPGALLVNRNPNRVIGAELAVAILAISTVRLGILHHPFWLAAGFLLHACWDYVKHTRSVGVTVVTWYPPLCAAFDAAVALVILAIQLK